MTAVKLSDFTGGGVASSFTPLVDRQAGISSVNMTKKYSEFCKKSHRVEDIYMALKGEEIIYSACLVPLAKFIFGAQHFVRIIFLLYVQKADYRYQIC